MNTKKQHYLSKNSNLQLKKQHYWLKKQHGASKLVVTLLFLLSWLSVPQSNAESVHDTLTLNGIALHSQLSREYYIGALYVPTPSRSSPIVIRTNGPKRIEIRVTSKRWTPRRFGQMWNQALSVNNTPEELKQITKEVVDFTRLIKKPLTTGDTIQIDYDPDKGSVIKLNNRRIKFIKSSLFFNALLKCWIGSRPPSSDFKKGILSITPFDKNLYARFQSLALSKKPVTKSGGGNNKLPTPPPRSTQPKPQTTADAAAQGVTSAINVLSAADKAKQAAERKAKQEGEKKRAEQRRLAEERRKEELRQRQIRQQEIERQEEIARQEAAEKERQRQADEAEKARLEAARLALEQEKAAERKRILAKVKGLKNNYHAKVLRQVYRKVIYPEKALERKQEGVVVLLAKINSQGRLKSLTFVEESNHSALDKAAKNAVQNAQPFGKPVKAILIDGVVELKVPIRFRLP